MTSPSLVSPKDQSATVNELLFDLVFTVSVAAIAGLFHRNFDWVGVGQRSIRASSAGSSEHDVRARIDDLNQMTRDTRREGHSGIRSLLANLRRGGTLAFGHTEGSLPPGQLGLRLSLGFLNSPSQSARMTKFRVLGTTELRRKGEALDSFLAAPKRVGLLAYLTLARPRGFHRRDKILPLFWPNRGQKAARNALSNLLYHMREALGSELLVSRGAEEIEVDRDHLSCDAILFEGKLDSGRLREAEALYEGELLEGFHLPGQSPDFDRWLDQERGRLRRRYHRALESLAEEAEQRGGPEEAAKWWRKRAEEDPLDSRAVGRLMEALVAAGRRAAALRVAQGHAQRLEEEFGVRPSEKIRALVEEIREESRAGPLAPARGPGSPSARAAPPETGGPDPAPRSIAVLLFEALGSEEASLFATGVHGDLVTRLSAASGLRVLSRTSVRGLSTAGKRASEIGAALGARWVLEGEVQTGAGQVQVNVRLVSAQTDQQAWSKSYQRALTVGNLFGIQSDVTKRIVQALEAELSAEEETRIERRPTQSLSAYRLYARGRSQLDQRTEEGIRRALGHFRRAVEKDPEYALAWAGLADALSLFEFYGLPRPEGEADPIEAARRAVELNPELGEACAALGILQSIRHSGPEALRELKRAARLAPSHAEAHIWLGWVRLCLGRREEGLAPAERAVELGPLAPAFHAYLAEIALANGNEERALQAARRAREIQPEYGLVHYVEGLVLCHQGRPVAAASALQRALSAVPPQGTPTRGEIRATLATIHVQAGDRERAETLLGEIDEASDPFSVGLVRAALGDIEGAFEAFEQVGDWGSFETEHLRYFFPEILGPVREDPRHEGLVQEVNQSWGLRPDGSLPEDAPTPPSQQ